jgi:hypothetical protein
MIAAASAATIHSVARARQPFPVTRDPHSEAERLPALLDDDELSPELVLVDPDVAERARDALPDITLTEIRLSLSIKVEQTPAPLGPQSAPEADAVAEPAPAPALVLPADRPAPPAYDEIRHVFHEPRLAPRRLRRSTMAALVSLGVAAGVALALPRALDGPTSRASADRTSSAARAPTPPAAHRAKAKRTSLAKPPAQKKAAARLSPAARPTQKAKPTAERHAAVPPVVTKPVSKHQPKAVHLSRTTIPDFVWVPAKNASGYLIEFRSGSKLVLRVRTRAARLHVSRRRLNRGRYRWLVWALNKAGSPAGEPLVDSRVRIR